MQMNARHQTTAQGAEGTTTQLQLVDYIQTTQFKSLKRGQKKNHLNDKEVKIIIVCNFSKELDKCEWKEMLKGTR